MFCRCVALSEFRGPSVVEVNFVGFVGLFGIFDFFGFVGFVARILMLVCSFWNDGVGRLPTDVLGAVPPERTARGKVQ